MCVSECLYVWGEGGRRNGAEVREQGIQVVSQYYRIKSKGGLSEIV